jgi:hypothetical protein
MSSQNYNFPGGNARELNRIRALSQAVGQERDKLLSSLDPPPPLEVLPAYARLLIDEAEAALGINPAYSLAGMIFAAAAATGATHQAEVKPGSVHSACLYLVIVGRPNSNKSGGLSFCLKPIFKNDANQYEDYRLKLKEYTKAIKAGQTPEQPVLKKTIVSDYSREALPKRLLENPRGLALYRDELSGWTQDFNRYGGGGEDSFWNQGWSGTPISIDRKHEIPLRINNPVISVTGTIQPDILKELAKGNLKSNGFMDRLLFAWPDHGEKALWTDNEIPSDLVDHYEAAINKLLALDFQDEDPDLGPGWTPKNTPHLVRFSDAAKAVLFEFWNVTNKQHCDTAENSRLASMHGKFDLLTIRLALVLQMLWYGYGEAGKDTISEATTRRAIMLAEWFRAQSLKVYRHLHERGPLEDLEPKEQQLYKKLKPSFTTKEAKSLAKKKFAWGEKTTQRFLRRCKSLDLLTSDRRGSYSKEY